MTNRPELKVNLIACDGRDLCAEVAPELIVLDDWGFPIIRPGGVPSRLEADALEAVRLCPKLALRLVSKPARLATAPGARQAHP
jgi:ferredoxin